jgi:hypothetical protein
MNPMTIGEYMGIISSALEKNPDLVNQPLYSYNGILFGWEDEEDAAERLGVSLERLRVLVNNDDIQGVRSNDHLIVPKNSELPAAPKTLYEDLGIL